MAAAGLPACRPSSRLEIAQGSLDDVAAELAALPAVLEAYATTGSSDVLCRLAASSHEDLQQALLDLNRSPPWPARPAWSCSPWWCRRARCRCCRTAPRSLSTRPGVPGRAAVRAADQRG